MEAWAELKEGEEKKSERSWSGRGDEEGNSEQPSLPTFPPLLLSSFLLLFFIPWWTMAEKREAFPSSPSSFLFFIMFKIKPYLFVSSSDRDRPHFLRCCPFFYFCSLVLPVLSESLQQQKHTFAPTFLCKFLTSLSCLLTAQQQQQEVEAELN